MIELDVHDWWQEIPKTQKQVSQDATCQDVNHVLVPNSSNTCWGRATEIFHASGGPVLLVPKAQVAPENELTLRITSLKHVKAPCQADPSSLFAKSPSDKFVASWDLMRLIRVYHPELWPPVHLWDFSHSVSLASSSNMIDILPQISPNFPKNPSTNPWVRLPQSGFNGFFLQFCSSRFVPTIHISHTSLWGRILTGQVTCYEDRRKNWRARWRLHFWGAASIFPLQFSQTCDSKNGDAGQFCSAYAMPM